MKIAIIANGQIDALPTLLPSILSHQRIIAVDGGLAYCKEGNLAPHLLVGDFDSCERRLLEEYASIPRRTLSIDKDETDLEVAIEEAWKQGATKVTLFGAWGKRIDHSLTNALFLGRYPGKISLETEREHVFAMRGRIAMHCQEGQLLSLIPLYGQAHGVTSSGLKWELQNRTLDQGFVGVSNVCLKREVSIEVPVGLLLCCLLKLGYS